MLGVAIHGTVAEVMRLEALPHAAFHMDLAAHARNQPHWFHHAAHTINNKRHRWFGAATPIRHVDVSTDSHTWLQSLDSCVAKFFDPAVQQLTIARSSNSNSGAAGSSNSTSLYIVHAAFIKDRVAPLEQNLAGQGFKEWTYMSPFDDAAVTDEVKTCFFTHPVAIGSNKRLSLDLKHGLAYYTMLARGETSAFVMEDDLRLSSVTASGLGQFLRRLSAPENCDVVLLSTWASGYLLSQAGARKLLSALQPNMGKFMNPPDWHMDLSTAKAGLKVCQSIVGHQVGTGTDH